MWLTFDQDLTCPAGAILTKMDGDSRGGAALSVNAVSGKPIKFVGMGEKLEALEPFYPDRTASRILGEPFALREKLTSLHLPEGFWLSLVPHKLANPNGGFSRCLSCFMSSSTPTRWPARSVCDIALMPGSIATMHQCACVWGWGSAKSAANIPPPPSDPFPQPL